MYVASSAGWLTVCLSVCPSVCQAFVSWLDDELAVPEEGLLVHGLFIDAGRWDVRNRTLTDPALGETPPITDSRPSLPTDGLLFIRRLCYSFECG